jgi:hypothetical protein
LFFPIILISFFVWRIYPEYDLKYFIGFAPAFYIFLSSGLLSLRGSRSVFLRQGVFYFMLISMVSINLISLHNFPKERWGNWKIVTAYLDKEAGPYDVLFVIPGKIMPVFDYYSKSSMPRVSIDKFLHSKETNKQQKADCSLDEFISKQSNQTWVLCKQNAIKNFTVIELLRNGFILEDKLNWGNDVLLYKKRNEFLITKKENSSDFENKVINPWKLNKSIAQGQYLTKTISLPKAGQYSFFVVALRSNTLPFYCNMAIWLDNKIIASYSVNRRGGELYKADTYINKGEHQVKVVFDKDNFSFNKKRRLFLSEIMYVQIPNSSIVP